MNEPKFEIGKHNWSQPTCVICGLQRRELDEEDSYAYLVNDQWGPVPSPCAPRLVEPFPGFFTTKEACVRLDLTPDGFVARVQTRNIHPAAVGANRGYYWREEQLNLIAGGRRKPERGSSTLDEVIALMEELERTCRRRGEIDTREKELLAAIHSATSRAAGPHHDDMKAALKEVYEAWSNYDTDLDMTLRPGWSRLDKAFKVIVSLIR